jgi:hypothetical protein
MTKNSFSKSELIGLAQQLRKRAGKCAYPSEQITQQHRSDAVLSLADEQQLLQSTWAEAVGHVEEAFAAVKDGQCLLVSDVRMIFKNAWHKAAQAQTFAFDRGHSQSMHQKRVDQERDAILRPFSRLFVNEFNVIMATESINYNRGWFEDKENARRYYPGEGSGYLGH